jgi:hypothetical protein
MLKKAHANVKETRKEKTNETVTLPREGITYMPHQPGAARQVDISRERGEGGGRNTRRNGRAWRDKQPATWAAD